MFSAGSRCARIIGVCAAATPASANAASKTELLMDDAPAPPALQSGAEESPQESSGCFASRSLPSSSDPASTALSSCPVFLIHRTSLDQEGHLLLLLFP